MAPFEPRSHDEARGHYRTAGAALLGMGLLGLVGAGILVGGLGLELGFIDGPSMAVVSGLMCAVGGWMRAVGGRPDAS